MMAIKFEGVILIDDILTQLRQLKKDKVRVLIGGVELRVPEQTDIVGDDVTDIINHWNKKISPGTRGSKALRAQIKGVLLNHEKEYVLKAIDNYSSIKSNEDSWLFQSKWKAEVFFMLKKYKLPDFLPGNFNEESFLTYEAKASQKKNNLDTKKISQIKELLK